MDYLFSLKGKVADGKKRGKNLGFPTANFSAPLTTPKGTYISEAILNDKVYPAITFIGTVDTFHEKDFVAETYILDFDREIYGQTLKINILKKLRYNKKFDSEKELVKQMKEDERITREYFGM